MPARLYLRYGKRPLDLGLSLVGLLLLAPFLALLALLVRVTLGSPVLFRQPRPGLGGRPFVLVKFRTMTDARDARGRLLPDGERLSAFGRFLRRSGIDELPELWNVLKGEMSLVGPRPMLLEYVDRYTREQARRHAVPPGITGLAQIRGRNAIPFSERLRHDREYVEGVSFASDCRILLSTVYLLAFARLFDGPGQHVSRVDDLGWNAESASGAPGRRADARGGRS
jgi:lipopolysaccharide/colanic/teichoic acid biosynthesis glycosyltransferase